METFESRLPCMLFLALALASMQTMAQETRFTPWQVLRSTDDLEIDTLRQLIRQQRYDDAVELCETVRTRFPESSFQGAKWAVEHSRVLVAKYCDSEIFDDATVPVVIAPVMELLDSYPDHPWHLFLKAQIYQAKRRAVLHLVSRAAISPLNQELKEKAIRFSVEVSGSTTDFIDEISQIRSQTAQQGNTNRTPSSSDLYRLQQTFMVNVVSLALLQTDLMDADSDDLIAAASRAEKLAIDASNVLPSGTEARIEVLRLRLEALIRMKQLQTAETLLQKANLPTANQLTPQWCALKARLRIAQGQELTARDALTAYYQHSLESIIANEKPVLGDFVPTDLALLEFFMRYGTTKRVNECLEWIEQRGGRYARLRADAIALNQLLRGNDSEAWRKNPALIAARSQQLIRSGNLNDAAELLVLSSDIALSDDNGIQFAVQAAAIYGQLKKPKRAGEVLRDASTRYREAADAAAAHLQAALLFSKLSTINRSDLVADLSEHLELWPKSKTARPVRLWLYDLFRGNQQFLDAAKVVTGLTGGDLKETDADLITNAWHEVLQEKSVDWALVSSEFYREYRRDKSHRVVQPTLQKLCLVLLEAESLRTINFDGANQFERAILQLRIQPKSKLPIPEPTGDWLRDDWGAKLSWRLLEDANRYPEIRESVSRTLLGWPSSILSTPELAQCLIWTQQLDLAIEKIERWVKESPNSIERMVSTAELLQRCKEKAALTKAAELWGTIAAGMQRGSDPWHEAKLARIQSLRKAGDHAAAEKLANYQLLTAPGLTDSWRKRYRAEL